MSCSDSQRRSGSLARTTSAVCGLSIRVQATGMSAFPFSLSAHRIYVCIFAMCLVRARLSRLLCIFAMCLFRDGFPLFLLRVCRLCYFNMF